MTLKWILNPAPLTEASDLNPMVTFFASTVIGRNADSFRPQNLLERESQDYLVRLFSLVYIQLDTQK